MFNRWRKSFIHTCCKPASSPRWLVIMLLWILFLPLSTAQGAAIPFTERFRTNANGDINLIGNSLFSSCNNQGCSFSDIDGDPSTTSSSSAELNLPVGSTVLWAGLYWAGVRPAINNNYKTIKLKTPVSGSYLSVLSQQDQVGVSNQSNAYRCFADITGYLKTAGNGTYTVADISAATGKSDYAGWGLVIVFQDEGRPLRNLIVFDGFDYIANNSGITITFSGFTTPLNGPVGTNVGFIVGNGSSGSSGDAATLAGVTLQDPLRPANNFFNGRATDMGQQIPRNPALADNLGWDLGRVNASGILANNATSADVRFNANSDKFFPYVFTFSTEIYVPVIAPNITKIGTDINGDLLVPGDILRYEIALSNTGFDAGTGVVLTDPIPPHTTYEPGSLRVITGANSGSKTDAGGDDQAEYCAGPPSCDQPSVIFRLGEGANGSEGGSLFYLASTSLSFDVRINPDIPAGTVLINSAFIQYSGQTLGASFAATSSLAAASVYTPPQTTIGFSPNPIDTGGTSTMTIVLTNAGTDLVTVEDVHFTSANYPEGLTHSAGASASLLCTPGTSATLTGGAPGGNWIGLANGIFPPNGSCTITVSVVGSALGNHTVSTGPVYSANGGTGLGGEATLSVGVPVIGKAFSPTHVLINQPAEAIFTITNPTVVPLTGLAFNDPLPAGLVVGSGAAQNGCSGTLNASPGGGSISLAAGSIGASSSCIVRVPLVAENEGTYHNTTSAITSALTSGLPSNTAVLKVLSPPRPPSSLSKSFAPISVAPAAPAKMTIVVANPNSDVTLKGVAFTDNYPSGLINTASPAQTLSCTPGSTAVLNSTASSIGLSDGSILPGGRCTLAVNVTANSAANYHNSTGAVGVASYQTTAGQLIDGAGVTGGPAFATLNVTNLSPPETAIAFAPASLPAGQVARMTITLNNPNASDAISGLALSMNYPSGLLNATPANLTTTCGGTVSSGSAGLTLSGGSIASAANCTVAVDVIAYAGATYYPNSGTIVTSNAATGVGASASVAFIAPPQIAKTFLTNPVGINTPTVLRFTLTNPGVNAISLTGVAFSDSLPPGMAVHSTPGLNNACTGSTVTGATSGSTLLSVSNVTLAANSSCTISVSVAASTAGELVNTTSAPTSLQGGTGLTASATLSVGQPGISLGFSPTTVLYGNATTLTATLANPTSTPMTGASFTNSLPAGLEINGTPAAGQCSGTVSKTADNKSYTLTGGSIPANGSCTVAVSLIATAAVSTTIPAGGLIVTGPTSLSNINAATASINVISPPMISKSFSPAEIQTLATSMLTITISNPNPQTMSAISFNDSYPSTSLKNNVAATVAGNVSCSTGSSIASVTGAINGSSLAISGGSLLGNGTCTITMPVRATAAGSYANSTGNATWTYTVGTAQTSTLSTIGTATLRAFDPISFGKAFTPAEISVYDTALLKVTLHNPNSSPVTGAAFTDIYPAEIVNSTTPGAYSSCGGTVTAAASMNSLALSGGTIPANGSCYVAVYVTSSSVSDETGWANTLASVTTSNAGTTSTPATAHLRVIRLEAPTLSMAFSPNPLEVGTTGNLTVTISNPNAMPILGAAFTDTYPVQIVNASLPGAATNCPGGVVSATGGGGSLSLNNAIVPANSSCTVSVHITSGVLSDETGWTNTIAQVASSNADPADSATATLRVILRYPTVIKTFTPATVEPNVPARLRMVLINGNSVQLTDVVLTDNLPTEPGTMKIAANPDLANDCPGTLTADAESGVLSLSGATLANGSTCTIEVDVQAFAAGDYVNTVHLTSAETGAGPSSSATLTVLSMPKLAIERTSNPDGSINPGEMVTHTIVLTNVGNDPAVQLQIVEELSPFAAMCLDSFSGEAFAFSTDAAALFINGAGAVHYADDYPPTWLYAPAGTGCDQDITHWRIELTGELEPEKSCTIEYQSQVN